MTMYQAAIHSFDCMDSIHVSLIVRELTPEETPNPVVLRLITDIQGTGETDPREWMRDALIAALEAL